jgi:SAM-dependent methyltransferase
MKHYLLRKALRFILWLHTFCYKLAGLLAIRAEGIHPKHRIMRYKEWFLEQFSSDDTVLDIGSNTGMMPALFATKAEYVYGVEIDGNHVAIACKKRSAENLEFIHADATQLDYSQLRPISVLTLSNVLEHIDDRVDFLKAVIAAVNWRDRKAAKLVIRVPCFDREWLAPLKKEMGLEWRLDRTHFTEYTESQFREELSAAGVEPVTLNIRFGEIYSICRIADV